MKVKNSGLSPVGFIRRFFLLRITGLKLLAVECDLGNSET